MAHPEAPAAPRAVIAAVVVTFRDVEATTACIASLLAAQPSPNLVVLVDNGSSDGSADRLAGWLPSLGVPWRVVTEGTLSEEDRTVLAGAAGLPRIVLLKASVNRGFGGGVNSGWRLARTVAGLEAVLLLNNDATVDQGFLGPLKEALEDPAVGVATGTIHHVPAVGAAWYAGGALKWWQCRGHHDTVPGPAARNVTFCTGCLMLIRAEVLEKLGGMSELYFLYYEDVELSIRVRRLGYTLRYVPASVVHHRVGATAGHRTLLPRTAFVSARNRFWLARRNLSPARRLVAVPNVLADEAGRLLGALVRGRPGVARAIAQGIGAGLFARADDASAEAFAADLRRRFADPASDA